MFPLSLMSTHFLNGRLVGESELMVSVRDLGFARGYAVFDFLVTYPTQRPFLLSRHIDRLFASAAHIGLEVPWTKAQVADWVMRALAANNDGKEKGIKIMISGGVSHSLIPNGEPTIAITIDERHHLPLETYEKGASVITVKHQRYQPEAKTNNYIEAVKQSQAARKVSAIEPVYFDDNQVYECSSSNIFAVIDGALQTPKSNILSGITREVLLEILQLDIPIAERDFTIEEFLAAPEVFLTASNKEVAPIVRIDNHVVGDGTVGRITKNVMQQFKDFTLSNVW